MKAIIMAGGMGTRLRPVTGELPKPMAPLCGRPIMEHIVYRLRDSGFEDICAALKYRAEDIMAYFGDGSRFGVKMQYRVETDALGTAGGVKNCADFYGEEDFLVISGDAACDFELEKLMQEHRRQAAAATIALYREPSPLRYGLALSDASGRIMSFIEKPDWPRVVTDRVNTGIYLLSPRAMELVPQGRSYDFGKELFPELLRRGEKIAGLEMQGYWCDIGTPLAYYKCCADAIEGRLKIRLGQGFLASPSGRGAEQSEAERETGEACPAQKKGRRPLSQPSGLPAPPEGEPRAEEVPCEDRAGLMARLSAELMELGADYSDGIRLRGGRMSLHIFPSAAASALKVTVQSEDAEFARDMLELAKKAVEEAAKEGRAGGH